MLIEMLGIKSDFEDTKDEDFSFEKDGLHYLFEFKGLTKDVKKSNIFHHLSTFPILRHFTISLEFATLLIIFG